MARRAGRSPVYSDVAKRSLVGLWKLMDCLSDSKSQRLAPGVDRRAGELDLPDRVTGELLAMSSATMGRIVRASRPRRNRSLRRARPRRPRAGGAPLRTWADWGDVQPGEVQSAPALPAGSSGGEGHLCALVVIDPYSGWLYAQAVDSLAQRYVVPALDRPRLGRCGWGGVHPIHAGLAPQLAFGRPGRRSRDPDRSAEGRWGSVLDLAES